MRQTIFAIKKVARNVCDQIKLLKIAFESAKKNLRGSPGPGIYSLYSNNCGTWAKTMVERAGLRYPISARIFWNAGATYGGPADYTGLHQAITASARRYAHLAQKLKQAR